MAVQILNELGITQEVLISVTPRETRIAVLENDVL